MIKLSVRCCLSISNETLLGFPTARQDDLPSLAKSWQRSSLIQFQALIQDPWWCVWRERGGGGVGEPCYSTRVIFHQNSTTNINLSCQGVWGSPACPKVSSTREYQKIQFSSLVDPGTLKSQLRAMYELGSLDWLCHLRWSSGIQGNLDGVQGVSWMFI